MNFSKKQIIGLIVIALIIAAIPPTIYLLQQRQIIKSNALQATMMCYPDDPAYPDGYEYTSGALDVYIVKSDGPGSTNEIGIFPNVVVNAKADHLNEPPASSPNHARSEKDGRGCGWEAEEPTDGGGLAHLEPLNCGHNNFKVTVVSGLPPNVVWVGATYNNGGLNEVDIDHLDLQNGTTGVVKLYYYQTEETPPPPIETPAPTPPTTLSPTPTPTPTPPPTCVYTDRICVNNLECTNANIDSDWCYAGKCISCATPPPPTSTPTPTPPSCPVPATVTNIRIECPYCP